VTKVWVEIDEDRKPLRVFKNHKAMVLAMPYVEDGYTAQMERREAVGAIREAIWTRQSGICLNCPTILTRGSFHMHEKISRGHGGEVSLENSVGLCYTCHITIAHGDRLPQFRTNKEKVSGPT
jgi:5-methylcytosine-specific restriction endonuclease McrA